MTKLLIFGAVYVQKRVVREQYKSWKRLDLKTRFLNLQSGFSKSIPKLDYDFSSQIRRKAPMRIWLATQPALTCLKMRFWRFYKRFKTINHRSTHAEEAKLPKQISDWNRSTWFRWPIARMQTRSTSPCWERFWLTTVSLCTRSH